MKKDIYHNEQRYNDWKKEIDESGGIEGISKKNSDLILKHIIDMEQGNNVGKGSKKGVRSYIRLNTIRIRLIFVTKHLESKGILDLTKLTQEKLTSLFNDMSQGKIKTQNGQAYKSVKDYIKVFKSFWHWFMKINRKKGIEVKDITEELDTKKEENSFVYFSKEELEKMMPYFSQDEQVRLLFMFDTIIRSPTELMNIKVNDIHSDFKEVTIRDEVAKTYGRTIKILLCSEELKKYVDRNKLKDDDFLFVFSAPLFNQKLQRVARQVFGDKMTKGGEGYTQISMYDFRHSGTCFWRLGAYRSKIDALMYRGGWSDLAMLNYYTKKIGMKDSVEEEDMLINVDKNKLQQDISELQDDIILLKQQLLHSDVQLKNKESIIETDFLMNLNDRLVGKVVKDGDKFYKYVKKNGKVMRMEVKKPTRKHQV
ncbi:tyrosine-type recombinase/integrase [Candidatus Pacearchaeota archaeon]|nr:tyrosine-type recombinase/integrase [Candidatus Pacearchaeota archaeon]